MALSFVVGYQTIPVTEGYVLFAPTFKNVAENDLPLSSIKIVDAAGQASSVYGEVTIQKMDDTGAYLDTYMYIEGLGWDGADGVTVKPGEAICVDNEFGDTVYFLVSGSVDLENKNHIGQGYVLWGNGTPVTVNLADVTIVTIDGEPSSVYGEVTAQKMDITGAYLDTYMYIEGMGWDGAEGVTLEPGESVCIDNEFGEDIYLKVPSPITK